ncbi:MAG: peptidoglycan-associated lipoprotein Pal [bacterium]
MKEKTPNMIFLLMLSLVMGFGSGCRKETVKYKPDPDPFPDVMLEEPDASERLKEGFQPGEREQADIDVKKEERLVLRTIYYSFDRADLNPQARAILAENARKLERNPNIYIRIEGHCDERGTVEYNLALGERRALAARNYMINYGIAPGRITIISYGKERPVDTRDTEAAWASNRRAEFVILNNN